MLQQLGEQGPGRHDEAFSGAGEAVGLDQENNTRGWRMAYPPSEFFGQGSLSGETCCDQHLVIYNRKWESRYASDMLFSWHQHLYPVRGP